MSADQLDRCRRVRELAPPSDVERLQFGFLRRERGSLVRDHGRAGEAHGDDGVLVGLKEAKRKQATGERLAVGSPNPREPAKALGRKEAASAISPLADSEQRRVPWDRLERIRRSTF